ncbi:helix-turn-helix transcriptional regulator [Kutzneria sp. 744]|uniref:helix-turn-helix transcriptional regulator n=1 Tax=Kutzneria sp. (strain 744) TaxID=345341 RepID=UPI0004AFA8F9|nr:helix-turn-helix transcriptional regulator [Kutzneria sp. 744]
MSESARRRKLGAFLRAHREHVKPSDIGLPGTIRRRTPGLRREEVAALAGIGLAWYTWLEQGRVAASKRVLDALAVALRLDEDAHRHMLSLAGLQPPDSDEDDGSVGELLQPVLDGWPTSPALLLDRRLDVIAWNEAYSALWTDPELLPRSRRNALWIMVGDPVVQKSLTDWEPFAKAVATQFRAQADRYPDDERIRQIYSILNRDNPELAHWWACHTVRTFTTRPVRVTLSGVGDVDLVCSMFRPVDNLDSVVLLLTPARAIDHQRVSRVIDRHRRREQAG